MPKPKPDYEIGQVRKGVPMPEEANLSKLSKIIGMLEVGDSFLVKAPASYVSAITRHATKKRGWEVATRQVNPAEVGVWRVK